MKKENVYEGLFILDPEAYARSPEEVSGQIAKTIESFGGTVRVSRLWEERKLAYDIKGRRRGTYWLTYFRLDTAQVAELNNQFQINNSILRFLLLSIDKSLEEALVEHAMLGPVKKEESPSDESFDDEDVDDDEDEEDVDLVDSIEEE